MRITRRLRKFKCIKVCQENHSLTAYHLIMQLLQRLGICFELASYVIACFVFISYATFYWSENEAFYLIEVDYLKWVTNLPAYTICPTIKNSFVKKQLNRLLNTSSKDAVEFVKGYMKSKGKLCRKCGSEGIKSVFNDNIEIILEYLFEPCEGVLLECSWNEVPFQCCRHFQIIHTENGLCFSLNSAHSKTVEMFPHNLKTSFYSPKAILQLKLEGPVRVYVHDRKDLGFFTKFPVRKIKPLQKAEITYKFIEWLEDSSAWMVPMRERNCTLAKEVDLDSFNVYSQSACRMECKIRQQLRKCGCKHQLLPGPHPVEQCHDVQRLWKNCGLEGLICLDEIYETPDCECLEECSRMEITYVRYSIEKDDHCCNIAFWASNGKSYPYVEGYSYQSNGYNSLSFEVNNNEKLAPTDNGRICFYEIFCSHDQEKLS